MKSKLLYFQITAFCLFLYINSFSQISNRIYTIGNSVTDGVNFAGFQAIANQKGNTHTLARHMIPGSPLELLWAERNIANSGFWTDPYKQPGFAFPGYEWDCITLQPFDRGITGTNGDLQISLNYMNLAKDKSPNVQFYIYSRYPRIPQGKKWPSAPATVSGTVATADDWNKCWDGTYGTGSQTNETKAFFENLVTAIRNANTASPILSKPVLMIPVGDVMASLNQKMAAGNLPGYTSIWDFYSDGIHVNNMGSFVIGATFFATLYKQDPRGLTVPLQYGTIADNVRDTILFTVYKTVFSHSLSGTSFADIIPPTGVTISPKSLTLSFMQSQKITATVLPSNAGNKQVSWSSNRTGVATVDQSGKVVGVGTGVATITGTTNEGGFKDFATVTVTGLANFTSVTGVLASWEFTGLGGQNSITGISSVSGISNQDGSLRALIGPGLQPENFGSNGLTASRQDARDLSTSLAGGEYFSFKVKPIDGKLVSIKQFRFKPVSQNRNRVFTLFSNIGGFTAVNSLFGINTGSSSSFTTVSITGHENLSSEVEFRLYVHYAGPNPFDPTYESCGIGNAAGNDIEITGDVITPVDNEKPSSVTGIVASQIKDNGFLLSWNESTDNMVVKGYNIFLNGVKLNSTLVENTSFQVSSLTSGLVCNITVVAVDFVGNVSNPSTAQFITNRKPTAVLNASVLSGAGPLTVDFNSNGSSDPDTDSGDLVLGFDWDFGNGQISSANSASIVYTAPGIYTVSLRVVDTRDLRSDFVYRTITVLSNLTPPTPPTALTVLSKKGNMLVISFTGATDNNIVSGYSISINGTALTLTNPASVIQTITGLSQGTLYSIRLRSFDGGGNNSTAVVFTAQTNFVPSSSFTLSSLEGKVPLSVTATGIGSDQDPGDILTYSWTIAGMTFNTQNVEVILTSPGMYSVQLAVKDSQDDIGLSTISIITVTSNPPIGTFSVSGLSGAAPFTFTADASGSSSPIPSAILTYDWTINGQNFSGSNITATISTPGIYLIDLYVSDNFGGFDFISKTITVTSINTVSGINDGNTINSIKVYPNPAHSELFVSDLTDFTIMNTLGVTIAEYRGVNNKINIEGLTPGLYFIKAKGVKGIPFIKH